MAEYIPKEALIADIDAAMDNAGMGYVVGQTIKRYIKRQPAADVAPVVHGRWVPKMDGFWRKQILICSNCESRNALNYEFNYCPNCGARMDGDG